MFKNYLIVNRYNFIVFIICHKVFFPSVFSQTTSEYFNELAKIYGYYYGQKTSVERIVELQPELSRDFLIAEFDWNKRFMPVIKEIEKELDSLLSGGWEDYKIQLQPNLEQYIPDDYNIEVSRIFLTDLQNRAKGSLESPFLELFLKHHPLYKKFPSREFSDGYKQKYNSKGTKNNLGIIFDFDFPKSWTIREGKRSNVLFLAKSASKNVMLICSIDNPSTLYTSWDKLLMAMSGDNEDKILFQTFLSDEGIRSMLDEMDAVDYRIINKQDIRLNLNSGVMVDYFMRLQRLDMTLDSWNRMYYFAIDGKLINFLFQVYKPINTNTTDHKEIFYKNEVLMTLIINSLLFGM